MFGNSGRFRCSRISQEFAQLASLLSPLHKPGRQTSSPTSRTASRQRHCQRLLDCPFRLVSAIDLDVITRCQPALGSSQSAVQSICGSRPMSARGFQRDQGLQRTVWFRRSNQAHAAEYDAADLAVWTPYYNSGNCASFLTPVRGTISTMPPCRPLIRDMWLLHAPRQLHLGFRRRAPPPRAYSAGSCARRRPGAPPLPAGAAE